jgi:hypothetical protein
MALALKDARRCVALDGCSLAAAIAGQMTELVGSA